MKMGRRPCECRRSVLALHSREEAKRGRSYEADVVKTPMVFSDLLIRFLRLADASEERANSCQRQKTVTCQCAAKLGQERNGINGRGPRSGKQTVYAGFDLDQASLRTAWLALCREPLGSMFNGLWRLHGGLGTIILRPDLRSVLGVNLSRYFFLERFPPET